MFPKLCGLPGRKKEGEKNEGGTDGWTGREGERERECYHNMMWCNPLDLQHASWSFSQEIAFTSIHYARYSWHFFGLLYHLATQDQARGRNSVCFESLIVYSFECSLCLNQWGLGLSQCEVRRKLPYSEHCTWIRKFKRTCSMAIVQYYLLLV